MDNVITLNFKPARREAQAGLAQCFAKHRRIEDDVFWLKENAELLNIHETGGATLGQGALEAYEGFYADVEKRMRFFPQYYRFLISITLDLEDLGMAGETGAKLCAFAASRQLADAELSDLQRAEAQRLFARRGIGAWDAALEERLHRFISHSATFALPNKKAAYELTHIVFYLSEYGRRDPKLSKSALRSLMYAGTLAYIDENADLLAEICVALRFAGADVPQAWEDWALRVEAGYVVRPDSRPVMDDYHEFLVCNWLKMIRGDRALTRSFEAIRLCFERPAGGHGLLRQLSEHLYEMPAARRTDWQAVRSDLEANVGSEGLAHLHEAEAAMPEFDQFFAGFARGTA